MNGHHRRLHAVRAGAVLCAAVVLLTFEANTSHVSASTLGDLKNKYSSLQQEQNQIKKELEETKDEKDRQLAIKQQLDGQISLTKKQLSTLDEQIAVLNGQISSKEEEIDAKQKEIEENMDLFQQRLRSMQVNNTSTQLGLLLGSDNFADFLSRAESINRITQHDHELVNKLIADQKEIEGAKQSIEEDKAEVEKSKSEAAVKKKELDSQLSDAKQQLQSIDQLEADYLRRKDKINADMKNVQKDIDKIYEQNQSNGGYVGGEFLWPVPHYSTITSYYGWRFNHTDFHTGIDISGGGVYGKPIVAANSGTVIKANRQYTPGVGYGMYVIIDHGGGMSTLYGHTSDIYVKKGDHVKKGQVIAAVGSTGWSTGPHLHFEIRKNGKHTNPLNWFHKG